MRANCAVYGLRNDQRGSILVFFIIALPMLVGAVGFAVDMVRAHTLQTELQRVADAAALAAAKELDFTSGSLPRARQAALALLNRPNMALSSSGQQILEPRFYSSLGPDIETTDGTVARFVRVNTVMRTSAAWFTRIVGGRDAPVDAEAWAQSSIQACGVAPLFFCVNKGFNPIKGTQLLMKSTNSYGPGNFGLLDPVGVSSGVGAKLIELNLASPNPSFCYTGATTVRTGNVAGPVQTGIGVRFDMYPENNSGQNATLKTYPPAPNVIKGKWAKSSNSTCSPPDDPSAAAQPRDPCIQSGTCWQGNGAWQTSAAATNYMTKNWGSQRPSGWPNLTRRELYLAELRISDESGSPNLMPKPADATSPENRGPACYQTVNTSPTRAPPNAARRTMNVAVVDCETNILQGNSTLPLSIMRIARFFLTEPSNSNGDIYAEFIDYAEPGDGGIRHLVQLVR